MKKMLLIALLSCGMAIHAAAVEESVKEDSFGASEWGELVEGDIPNGKIVAVGAGMFAAAAVQMQAGHLKEKKNEVGSPGALLRAGYALTALVGRGLLGYFAQESRDKLGHLHDIFRDILSGYLAGTLLFEGLNIFVYCVDKCKDLYWDYQD